MRGDAKEGKLDGQNGGRSELDLGFGCGRI